MSTEVSEKTIDLDVETVVAESVVADVALPRCYPLPLLRRTGQIERRRFRAIVLENSYLETTLVPELGGRLISVRDKRTGIDIVSIPEVLSAVDCPGRGVRFPWGIEVLVGGRDRPNSAGPVEARPMQGDSIEGSQGVVLRELVNGTSLGWHASISLPSGRAALRIAFRCHNRNWSSTPHQSGVSIGIPGCAGRILESGGVALYSPVLEAGLALLFERSTFDSFEVDESARLVRGIGGDRLAPRWSDAWELEILPFGGIGEPDAASHSGAIAVGEDALSIQAATMLNLHKVVALGRSGRAYEAVVDLDPHRAFQASFDELDGRPEALSIRDGAGDEVLRWDDAASRRIQGLAERVSSWTGWSGATSSVPVSPDTENPEHLRTAERIPEFAGAAHMALALLDVRRKDWDGALGHLDDAIGCLAEDPLAWWFRAVVERHSDSALDETGSLENAHYLAPLEPALRAEAFLRQPVAEGRLPASILQPMVDDPDAMIEAVALYLDAGLYEDVLRLGSALLESRDEPMLRYLIAHALLEGSRMDVEAAQQVAAAAAAPLAPPYPWRPIEFRVLRALAERFPSDARIGSLIAIVAAAEDRGDYSSVSVSDS